MALLGVWCSGKCDSIFLFPGAALFKVTDTGNRNEDKPSYYPGIYACIACALMNLVLLAILTVFFRIENAKADRGEKELETSDEDYQPGFRYTC